MTDETELTAPRPKADDQGVDPSGVRKQPEYEVGYRRPPKGSQFRKGRSGNPSGLKKAKPVQDIRSVVDGILEERVQVRDGKQIRTVSTLEGILQAQRQQALTGNPKAAFNLFKMAKKADMLSEIVPKSFVKIMEPGGEDGKIIRMYHAEQEAIAKDGDGDQARPSKRSKGSSNKRH